MKGVSITGRFDNDKADLGKLSDLWLKQWIRMSSLGWEMAPGPPHVSPHPQAGPTLRMAWLGYVLSHGEGALVLPLSGTYPWLLQKVFRGVSHIGAGVWYVRNQIHIFFFNSGKKNDPLLKNESTEIYRSWVKSNKGEWLLSSSYLKADICRGNRNSEDKCKNGWGKRKHSFRDRSMADQLCNVMLTFRRNLPEWLICERGLLPMG